jgi:hypothetical protein
MSIPEQVKHLVGEWNGITILRLSPDSLPEESKTTAKVKLQARGKFISIDYTWSTDDGDQAGFLLLGCQQQRNSSGVWIDSWHMNDQYMPLDGNVLPNGSIGIRGSYAAPPEPDWGCGKSS